MVRTRAREAEELTVRGIEGFYEKVVTSFGNGAKIDCPRQYLGRAVYVVIRRPGAVTAERVSRRRPPTRRQPNRPST